MRRYLVVSNQTLGGAALAAKVKAALEEGPAEFHLVVPATAPSHFAWTEGEARAIAQERLDGALRWFSLAGATATGEVADERQSERNDRETEPIRNESTMPIPRIDPDKEFDD